MTHQRTTPRWNSPTISNGFTYQHFQRKRAMSAECERTFSKAKVMNRNNLSDEVVEASVFTRLVSP